MPLTHRVEIMYDTLRKLTGSAQKYANELQEQSPKEATFWYGRADAFNVASNFLFELLQYDSQDREALERAEAGTAAAITRTINTLEAWAESQEIAYKWSATEQPAHTKNTIANYRHLANELKVALLNYKRNGY